MRLMNPQASSILWPQWNFHRFPARILQYSESSFQAGQISIPDDSPWGVAL
jgi:hypothetical protein